jgi:hypothetical protein
MAYLKAFEWECEEGQIQRRYSIARPHKYEVEIQCRTENLLKIQQEYQPQHHEVR